MQILTSVLLPMPFLYFFILFDYAVNVSAAETYAPLECFEIYYHYVKFLMSWLIAYIAVLSPSDAVSNLCPISRIIPTHPRRSLWQA